MQNNHRRLVARLLSTVPQLLHSQTREGGATPLHVAVQHGYTDLRDLLVLKHGAPVNVVDREGRTPLMLAVINQDLEGAVWLLERYVRIVAMRGTKWGLTTFLCARGTGERIRCPWTCMVVKPWTMHAARLCGLCCDGDLRIW